MIIRLALIILLSVNHAVASDDWRQLDGPEITAALTARTVSYGKAVQGFFADGRTLYESPIPSWGKWQAQNDKYCSLWPPQGIWACYDLEQHKNGLRLRFISSNGDITEGHYIDLN